MGDTSETNTKVLSQEMFFLVYIEKNHFLRDMGPCPRYCHIFLKRKACWEVLYGQTCLNFLEDNCHNMEEHKKVRYALKKNYARAYYLPI